MSPNCARAIVGSLLWATANPTAPTPAPPPPHHHTVIIVVGARASHVAARPENGIRSLGRNYAANAVAFTADGRC